MELGIAYTIIPKEEAVQTIGFVLEKFQVQKTFGHIAINIDNEDTLTIPFEQYEFTYPMYLTDEPVYLFFAQNDIDKNSLIKINSARKLGVIFENCPGMEYFVTNESFSYLLAVNWYVIEGIGEAKQWMEKLSKH